MTTRIQYRTAPARVRAFVECPNCGHIPKAETEITVVLGSVSPSHIHCHFRCERCGSRKALLHLEREIFSVH